MTRVAPACVVVGTAVFALAILAEPSGAQTVNPNIVMFRPSPHHSSLGSNMQPLVTGYLIEIYPTGSPEPILVIDLDKPTPDADGYIRAHVGTYLEGFSGPTLEARVAAVGPEGVSRSPLSNIFVVNGCRYLLPGSVSVGAAGGAFSVPVATADRCGWQARPRVAWLSSTLGASGAGAGHLDVSAAANPNSTVRVGILEVGSQLILVFQAADATATAQGQ